MTIRSSLDMQKRKVQRSPRVASGPSNCCCPKEMAISVVQVIAVKHLHWILEGTLAFRFRHLEDLRDDMNEVKQSIAIFYQGSWHFCLCLRKCALLLCHFGDEGFLPQHLQLTDKHAKTLWGPLGFEHFLNCFEKR